MLYKSLKSERYTFIEDSISDIKIDVSIEIIYETIFKNYSSFILEIGNKIVELDNIDENIVLHDSIKEIKEKYDREYGLSINDFEKLNKCIKTLSHFEII